MFFWGGGRSNKCPGSDKPIHKVNWGGGTRTTQWLYGAPPFRKQQLLGEQSTCHAWPTRRGGWGPQRDPTSWGFSTHHYLDVCLCHVFKITLWPLKANFLSICLLCPPPTNMLVFQDRRWGSLSQGYATVLPQKMGLDGWWFGSILEMDKAMIHLVNVLSWPLSFVPPGLMTVKSAVCERNREMDIH